MIKNAPSCAGVLTAWLFLSAVMIHSVSAEPRFYPEMVPCPGPAVEVKSHHGIPTIFYDGVPNAGIMANPTEKWGTGVFPRVDDGLLIVSNRPGSYTHRSVTTTNAFTDQYSVEAAVTVKELTGSGGNASLRIAIQSDRVKGTSAYLLSLADNKGVKTANLWKEEAGLKDSYRKWVTVPFPWEIGKTYVLKMAFDGKTVSASIDGKDIGRQADDKPLTSGKVEVSVYHSICAFDNVSVTRPHKAVLFSDDFSSPRSWDWNGQPLERAKSYAEIGVHTYTASAWGGTDWWSACWLGPGKYDYSKIDRDFEQLVKTDPKALIFPRVYLNAPEWWLEAHPEEAAIVYTKGRGSHASRFPSFTSKRWLKDVGEFLRQYIRHINSSPYGDRFIGVLVGGGHAMEWVYNWESPLFHDYSKNQLNAFRAWLKTVYPDVAALRAAWKDPNVTFETAEIPSMASRMKGDRGVFYDPAKGRKVSDYRRFHSIAVSDALLHLCKIAHEETQGKRLVVVFYGYVLNSHNIYSVLSG